MLVCVPCRGVWGHTPGKFLIACRNLELIIHVPFLDRHISVYHAKFLNFWAEGEGSLSA